MKKVKFTPFGKAFNPPFVEQPDYYKTKTYEEVLKAVRKDIGNNFYKFTRSADELKRLPDDPDYLTKMPFISSLPVKSL